MIRVNLLRQDERRIIRLASSAVCIIPTATGYNELRIYCGGSVSWYRACKVKVAIGYKEN
jgi:hypothetical protein